MTATAAPVVRLCVVGAALLLVNPVRAAEPPLPKQTQPTPTPGHYRSSAPG
jgi:hypothetical protein